MKTITVKFAGPTNTRGDRWVARAGKTSLTVSNDYELDAEANADRAALTLAKKMNWGPVYRGGTLPDGITRVYTLECVRLQGGTSNAAGTRSARTGSGCRTAKGRFTKCSAKNAAGKRRRARR